MASVVGPLVNGFLAAASGTAEFSQAGTATPAVVYSDSEGVTVVTTHALDATGGIVRYVEERVDVVVKDVVGATVRTFTWGGDARDARVENSGFTGTNAVGATVTGGRTTVDAVLSRFFTSLGTLDGNVLVGGVATPLSLALSTAGGLIYNVKAYGAVGDGVANDSSAIQAAINAADAAGGGIIYFPHGTYLCSSALVVANSTGKFFFLGDAASGTSIKQGTSGITLLALGNSNQQVLMNLAITATSTANTGTLISVGTAGRANFINCNFTAINGTTVAMGSAASRANFIGCTLAQAGAASRLASGVGAYVRFSACDISTSGASLTSFSDAIFVISVGTNWTLGGAEAGGASILYSGVGSVIQIQGGEIRALYTSGTIILCNSASSLQITGVAFSVSGGAIGAMAAPSASLYESACIFSTYSATAYPSALAGTGNPADGHSATRARSYIITSGSATSYTPMIAYNLHEVISSGASMVINDPSTAIPTGWPLIVVYKNTSAGNITPTFGTAYSFITAPAVVNAGNSGVYAFLPRFGGSTNDLVCISPQPVGGTTLA